MSVPETKDNSVLDELILMKQRMETLYSKSFTREEANTSSMQVEDRWQPPADVCENRTEWIMIVDLPGVAEADLQVKVDANELIIEGRRVHHFLGEDSEVLQQERPQGYFTRTFPLPSNARTEAVTADFKRGVLTVTIPKDRSASHKVEVRTE